MPTAVDQTNGTNSNGSCRIVLTGGPGGGKTTVADLFRCEIGDRVVIVPEAATVLFTALESLVHDVLRPRS